MGIPLSCTAHRDLDHIPYFKHLKGSTSTMGNDIQEEQASKLKKNNPLGKVADKVKSAVSGDDGTGSGTNVKSDDIGFKPTDPTGKDGRAVAENDIKSAGDTTRLPTMTGTSGHPTN